MVVRKMVETLTIITAIVMPVVEKATVDRNTEGDIAWCYYYRSVVVAAAIPQRTEDSEDDGDFAHQSCCCTTTPTNTT